MPRLLTVSIERFRGIREGQVRDLADVNVVVGRNNSGKSTVAEAMCLLAQLSSASNDPLGRDRSLAWAQMRKRPHLNAETWYRRDQSAPILIRASHDAPGAEMRLEIAGQNGGGSMTPAPIDARMRAFARGVTVFFPSDLHTPFEQTLWADLFATRRDKTLVAALRSIFGAEVEQLVWTPSNELLLAYPEYAVSLDAHGDGTRATLRCLMVLAALSGGMLILEEPENHHHPESLRQFARAVCAMARAQQVQLWVNTHSVECVRAFLDGARDAASEAALYSFRLNNGALDARRFTADTVDALDAAGTDPRYLDLHG
jgi:hypothetical protein